MSSPGSMSSSRWRASLHLGHALAEQLGDRQLDEFVLALVVPVDGAGRQPGLGDDVGHRGASKPLRAKQRIAAWAISVRRAIRCSSVTFGMGHHNKKERSFLTSRTAVSSQ